MPVLETVHNISFLSTILVLYSEISLPREQFGIGHFYIYTILVSMTDTMTSQNIHFSFWDTVYNIFTFKVLNIKAI
jgi:hypothetical protein